MKGIIWEPYGDYIEKSNITRFMKKYGLENYHDLINRSVSDIEWFWDAALNDLGIEWYQPYEKILDTSGGFPWAKWFIGGKINIVHNCIDRHLKSFRSKKVAFIWEGADGEVRRLTYEQMSISVSKVANGLKGLGLRKGDRVGVYMPMIPEVVVAIFACFKIGAVAIPIFSGFGAGAVATRLNDAGAKILFTADGFLRREKMVYLKDVADKALDMVPSIKHVIVYKRLGIQIPWDNNRDIWWSDLEKKQSGDSLTEQMDSEDTALIIYSSGTTGKPKGTVHTHAGCLAQMTKEVGYSFDLKDKDVFYWVTDMGWMMGPWEIIGVQHFGGTYLIFEGVPNHPGPDRLWDLVERHNVSILGVSPTLIRLLMRHGEEWITRHHLHNLRILGSTGEPWDPESYKWYFEKVGGKRCPVINISGGTEIVGCLLLSFPITPLKPCTLGGPGLGMDIDVFDEEGNSLKGKDRVGYLVCKKPSPSMTKGFLNDPERYIDTYFSRWPEVWYHGDLASVDEDGFWFLHGRADDTIKVGGKRIGPAEVEAAIINHSAVSEAASIGVPDAVKGEAIVCFVILKSCAESTGDIKEQLKDKVAEVLGRPFKPDEIKFVKELPKTRSGKILRGLIKKKFLGQEIGDISSVENPDAINEIVN